MTKFKNKCRLNTRTFFYKAKLPKYVDMPVTKRKHKCNLRIQHSYGLHVCPNRWTSILISWLTCDKCMQKYPHLYRLPFGDVIFRMQQLFVLCKYLENGQNISILTDAQLYFCEALKNLTDHLKSLVTFFLNIGLNHTIKSLYRNIGNVMLTRS